MNSKTHLNVKAKTIKPLEENTEFNIYDPKLGEDFQASTPKSKIDKTKRYETPSNSKPYVLQLVPSGWGPDNPHSERKYLQIKCSVKDTHKK